MAIIGLDVATHSTGCVVGMHHGIIETAVHHWKAPAKLKLDVTDRAHYMAEKLSTLLDCTSISRAYIEDYGFASMSLAPQAEVKGLLLWVLRRNNVPWTLIGPQRLKKYAMAKDKETTRVEVFKRWGFEHESNDVVDAYVLARIGIDVERGGPEETATKPMKEVVAAIISGK